MISVDRNSMRIKKMQKFGMRRLLLSAETCVCSVMCSIMLP
jgi:hypothetical protein